MAGSPITYLTLLPIAGVILFWLSGSSLGGSHLILRLTEDLPIYKYGLDFHLTLVQEMLGTGSWKIIFASLNVMGHIPLREIVMSFTINKL